MFSIIVHRTHVFGTPLKSDFHGTIPDMVLQTAYKTVWTLVWSKLYLIALEQKMDKLLLIHKTNYYQMYMGLFMICFF
jgi:hypothetical protein